MLDEVTDGILNITEMSNFNVEKKLKNIKL